MADLPNGMGRDIHGDGDSVHGDEHSSDDGRSSAARSMPSYADSMASGFPGDLETNILRDTTLRPPDENDSDFEGFTDGDWHGATQDDGANDDSKGSKQGTFGVLCGNWGNKWSETNLNDHMNFDLKSSPCALLILQEAPRELLEHLRQPGVEGVIDERLDDTRGGGENWLKRPQHEFIGIRGPEKDTSVLIAARTSLVQAVCLRLFRFREDGIYKAKKTKERSGGAKKMARSRILIVSCRMRFFKFPLIEDTPEEELVVVSVHLHYQTAKKEVSNGAVSLAKFWDELAAYIVEFRGRILAGDFNMALWQVIPELRMRGLQVNLAAWYPFHAPFETATRIDSTAIFIVGPVDGIRKIFDASALGISPAQPSATDFRGGGDMPAGWKLKEKVEKGQDGRELRSKHPVPNCPIVGSGYPLTSYRPQNASRISTMVRWNFQPAIDNESAVAEVVEARRRDRDLFPKMSFLPEMPGGQSEHWPPMPLVEQKLVGTQMFDPDNEFFRRGAHMPLMIFVGGNKDTRRSEEATRRRAARRQKVDGKWQGKGKGGETDSRARGSGRWTGGESRASNSWTQGSWSSNSWTGGGDGWARSPPPRNHWMAGRQQPGERPENVATERESMWRRIF